jgi:hypothetical protein
MLVTITNEQKVELVLAPLTAAGNPAAVDGIPVWEVTSGDATLEVAEDGLSCYLVSGEANVNSVIIVKADADLGEGVAEITDTVDLAVVAASASSLGLVVGTAELK